MTLTAGAAVDLPSVLSDNMVLQRNRAVPVWGSANPGEQVTVSFRDRTVSTKADADGKWRVDLPAGQAGGPFEMTVAGENTITLKNILVGEVWVCSGQSNMEMAVQSVCNASEEITQADYPEIRLFNVPRKASLKPLSDCEATWVACSPETVKGFSAVGYFFGRDLYNDKKVPVGLIGSSWGGTYAETWTPREKFMTCAGLEDVKTNILEQEKDGLIYTTYLEKVEAWEKVTHRGDPGNQGLAKGWAKTDFQDDSWKEITLPARIDEIEGNENFDGTVWVRKAVDVPESWAGKDLEVQLGAIDDFDITYFNGKQVGETGSRTVNSCWVQRKYRIPAAEVKAGRNVIAVRVFDNYYGGGFIGKPEQMKLLMADQPEVPPISLAGAWKYQIGVQLQPINMNVYKPNPPLPLGTPNAPCALYNGMIQPLLPFAIKGALWYQGESNAGMAKAYQTLFPAMIESWREAWGQGDFPFLFVQLANFMAVQPEPSEAGWAELREAQTMTLNTPNTGMAVIIDIGEANDIHPKNKQDVAKRLYLAARSKGYGENIVYSGPLFESMAIQDGKAVLRFTHIGGGLVAKGGEPLKGFAVAGADGKFVWAQAKIEGETVLVSSDQVAEPVAVRYAWAHNPICNLYNKEGLPASPFRTDDGLLGK
jgi:sialate O-acetylesterase